MSAWDGLGRVLGILVSPAIWLIIRFTTRTKVLIVYKDQALVVKSWLRVHNKWSLPGGGIKHHELPLPAALREVNEETGLRLRPSDLHSLGVFKQTKGYRSTYHSYLAHLTEKPALASQNHEINEIKFIPISELNANNAEQHVTELLRRRPVA